MDNLLQNFNMYITKSSFSDGLMKWSAINSDTESDLYGEKMTIQLYHKMLSYIENKVPPPAEFRSMVCSDYWCGGMPYVSLAHYPDMNGKAALGEPLVIYVDGNRLKAKGLMFDTPLGRAAWKGIKEDEALPPDEDKIRISIAFLDLAHKHGDNGSVFERKSITSVCPECLKGVGNKIYLDGYLVHLALTRKPVNPRTKMEEDIMTKKSKSITTRKEDAVSIVGDESLVEEIEKSALEVKSDVLIEMSDTVSDTPVVEEAKTKKDTEEMTAKDEQEADMEDDMDGDEYKDKKKESMSKKSLTQEDVVEIVKSVLAEVSAKAETPVSTEKSNTVAVPDAEVKKSALDLATDELYNSINQAIQLQGATIEQRLEAINPALQNLGTSITSLVRESMGVEVPAPVSNDQAVVLEAITSVAKSVEALAQKVAIIEEKSQTPSANVVQSRIPAPRSIQPVVSQSQTSTPSNPNSIANIVRRSVSQSLPLK